MGKMRAVRGPLCSIAFSTFAMAKGQLALADAPQFNEGRSSIDQPVSSSGGSGATSSGGVSYKETDLSITQIDTMIEDWKRKENNSSARFIYLPPTVKDAKLRNIMRVGIFKALNHLCLGAKDLVTGKDISNGAGAVFAFEPSQCFLPQFQANAAQHWDDINKGVEKQLSTRNSPAAKGFLRSGDQPDRMAAHQFVYNASHGGVYNQVMEWPGIEGETNSKYQISQNIGLKTYVTHAIVCGPRLITGHRMTYYGDASLNTGPDGQKFMWFFRSHDEFSGRPGGEIAQGYKSQAPTESNYRQQGSLTLSAAPGDTQTAVASEWWFQMPNGFLAWGIHGEGTQERSAAESGFAVDPYNPGLNLETGRCITCHSQGPKRNKDESTPGSGWSAQADLDKAYDAIYAAHEKAMRTLVTSLSGADNQTNDDMIKGTIEPVLYTLRVYEDERTQAGEQFGKRENSVNQDARDTIGVCTNFCVGTDGQGKSLANQFCESAPKAGRLGSENAAGGGNGSGGGGVGGGNGYGVGTTGFGVGTGGGGGGGNGAALHQQYCEGSGCHQGAMDGLKRGSRDVPSGMAGRRNTPSDAVQAIKAFLQSAQ